VSLFATSSYVLLALRRFHPDCPVRLIPGISAVAAAEAMVLALLKLGQRWSWLRPLLERRGLLERSLFARRIGWPDQLVRPAAAVADGEAPYFSLLLIRQGWPDLLP
jgi:precorrin-2/cobalt-factor-2 C20-methyltransferase